MPGGSGRDGSAVVRTFLIADVRGYTRFTQTRGDEAAARLAARFADVAHDVVTAAEGQLQELRGDEAMCVFGSPRQAVRAAIELQRRFVELTLQDPDAPLGVGIGIDAGEAVQVKGGYRGGALNLAARLCSLAQAGEILVSREAAHLAGQVDHIRYADRGPVALKGIDTPPVVMRVLFEDDPAADPAFRAAVSPKFVDENRNRKRTIIVAGVAAAVVLADIGIVIARTGGLHAIKAIGTNAVGVVSLGQSVLYQRVPVGAGPGALAATNEAVWVANAIDGTVSVIDVHHSNVADTVPVGHDPAGIATSEGAVWVANANDRSVSRIDSQSKTVVAQVSVGNGPTAIAASDGQVWVANTLDGTVSVIDPKTNHVVATLPVGGSPSSIAVGQQVWVSNSASASVSRIDPATRQVVATIAVGNDPVAVAVVKGQPWVANALDGTVSRINQATNTVTSTVVVGGQPSALAGSGHDLWVADSLGDRAARINVDSGRVTRVVHLGNAPQSEAIAGGRLWLSARGSGRSHRGGTVHMPLDPQIPSFDPNLGYTLVAWQVESIVYDGLVTFQRVGGPGGALIVPDLAVALPTISDGGKTYTFQLRPGIRYSNGQPVQASDFLASIRRELRIGTASFYYQGFVGAQQCGGDKPCTELSQGIVANNATRTLQVHLAQPDPELLYKLAMPFASFVGANPPKDDVQFHGLPGTGPYFVAANPPHDHVVLQRNPYFHEWSHIAQPDGYPNAIDMQFVANGLDNHVADATAHGQYDFFPDAPDPDVIRALRITSPTQLHSYPQLGTRFFFLNARRPPFNDIRVRRAVNFAFDRREAAQAYGGDLVFLTTCQVLPPSIYGYAPYCPYTQHPNASGVWTAPDLARARQLVAATGTAGMTVDVPYAASHLDSQQPFVHALQRLGYRVRLHSIGNLDGNRQPYYSFINVLAHHPQAGEGGWFADYPAPSNFIQLLLSCAAIVPENNQNVGEYCNHDVDRRIATAEQLQLTDPAAAGKIWATIDRQITDDAAWVADLNDQGWDLVSARVGNYQHLPVWGLQLDQIWVQ